MVNKLITIFGIFLIVFPTFDPLISNNNMILSNCDESIFNPYYINGLLYFNDGLIILFVCEVFDI